MFNSAESFINNKISYPIILLFGDDEFSREEVQNKLLAHYIADENDKFNLDIFDAEEIDVNSLVNLCRSYPMMGDKRVVLVKRFEKLFSGRISKKVETSSPFISYLNEPLDSTFLILVASIDGAKDFYKNFKSSNKEAFQKKVSSLKFPFKQLISQHAWMEFPRIYESEYPKWVESRFNKNNKSIQPEALEILVSRTKQNLRDLNNEVEKILLATEDKREITLKDVSFLTGSTREFTVFELQKSIAERNISKAIKILNNILSVDRQEMLMIAIFSKFFINLLKISDEFRNGAPPQVLASKLGISTYQFNDYVIALKNYLPEDIENAITSLCNTDLKMKSSISDGLMVMQNMLFDIMEKKVAHSTLL